MNDARIRKATRPELPAVCAVLADAFFDDPVMNWWIPDGQRRKQLLPGAMELLAGMSLEHNAIYTTDDLIAGAVWVPPGKQPTEQEKEQMGPLFAEMAQEHAPRAFQLMALTDEKHPKDNHHYLFILGTAPAHQGKGIGSALMEPVLRMCDRDQLPAYLEASSERNVRLYLRHNFKIVDEVHLPDGPTMWCMWRDPVALHE
ncbi:MAG: GNAT family N-acetyltransferase [Actinomycetota bacterium]